MNKNSLSIAVSAALAAGSLFAGVAHADVKLYGKLHMSVDYVDPKGAGDSVTSNSTAASSRKHAAVSSNATRWGIDVSEKLGGGLTAIGKLEQALYADGEDNSQTSHARWVGLKGGFGQITAGIHESAFKLISRAYDLFPEAVGDSRNILVQGNSAAGANFNANNQSIGWEQRPPNSVQYVTPKFGGFEFSYLYSADSTAFTGSEDNRRRLDTLGLKYAGGPLTVAYAHETHRFNTIADGGKPQESGDRLGASYDFGAFKLIGLYQYVKDVGGTAVGATSINRKSWGMGGAYTVGNNVFKAQYYKANDLSSFSNGASGTGTGAKMWAIGWEHLFSKTTKAYVAYAKTDNDSNAAFSVNGPGLNARSDFIYPATGLDPSAWSIGMIVDF